jgi:hypothetical protein
MTGKKESDTEGKSNKVNLKMDRFRLLAGIVVLGSIWGIFECTLGGFNASIGGIDISMGAVLAGFFGLGFMVLAMRTFNLKGAALGIAIIAGIMRYFAPVGSFVLCSAIAIMAEGVVFEIIMNRPSFSLNASTMKDPRSLSYLGVIMAYIIFVTGYVVTQILTPILGSDSGSVLDVVGVLPIILGSGFFAALLGGVSLPLVTLAPQLEIDVAKVKKVIYYPISTGVSAFCWVMLVLIYHVSVF